MQRLRRTRFAPAIIGLFVVVSALLLCQPADEKRITIYSNTANYSLPVLQRNGTDYVGLLEIFEPLGKVSGKTNGPHWKFRYNETGSEFSAGKTHSRISGSDYNLPANFLLENDRGFVPLSSLSTLMPRILGGPVSFNQASRRLFIGNVAIHFTAQIGNTNPPKLVMNFSAPVNPMIATEPGKLRMIFSHEPIVSPAAQTLTFANKQIPAAAYEENNGEAEVTVTGTVPLIASFSNDGRTITVSPPAAPGAQVQTHGQAPYVSIAPSSAVPAATNVPVVTRHFFAVIDASHGGTETGAALTDQLAEKDVTLAMARMLRQELEARGITAMLVRDSDSAMTLDERAAVTNSVRPAIYICLHAASQGNGVRLYRGLLPAAQDNRGPFLDWDTAQASYQASSQTAESSIATVLQGKRVPVRSLTAMLRPLNNVAAAALAIEVAAPGSDVSQLSSPTYQQAIASDVAAGIADIRDELGASR